MMITEHMEVSDKIVASGGCGDVRTGMYMGGLVAVKSARIATRDNVKKIKKVRFNAMSVPAWDLVSTIPPPAILQGSHSLGNFIPSEHLEARWGSGRRGERTVRHGVRVDVAWEHYGVHCKQSHQQTGTGASCNFLRYSLR
jgi:hypothetical protein